MYFKNPLTLDKISKHQQQVFRKSSIQKRKYRSANGNPRKLYARHLLQNERYHFSFQQRHVAFTTNIKLHPKNIPKNQADIFWQIKEAFQTYQGREWEQQKKRRGKMTVLPKWKGKRRNKNEKELRERRKRKKKRIKKTRKKETTQTGYGKDMGGIQLRSSDVTHMYSQSRGERLAPEKEEKYS